MARTLFEIASVINRYGADYRVLHRSNNYQLTILNALAQFLVVCSKTRIVGCSLRLCPS